MAAECPICQAPLDDGAAEGDERPARLSCGHALHAGCLARQLAAARADAAAGAPVSLAALRCAVCRRALRDAELPPPLAAWRARVAALALAKHRETGGAPACACGVSGCARGSGGAGAAPPHRPAVTGAAAAAAATAAAAAAVFVAAAAAPARPCGPVSAAAQLDAAMSALAIYECSRAACGDVFWGGLRACDAAPGPDAAAGGPGAAGGSGAAGGAGAAPELARAPQLCPRCDAMPPGTQACAKHGRDAVVWKCL